MWQSISEVCQKQGRGSDSTYAEKLLPHVSMLEQDEKRGRRANEQAILVEQKFIEGDHERYLEGSTVEGPGMPGHGMGFEP